MSESTISGLSKSSSVAEIIAHLEGLGTPENIASLKRYAINADKAFGVPNSVLRPLARQIGRDHARALDLWQTGWREARLLAGFTDEKKLVTADQAREWAADFNSWEIVDLVVDLFVDAGLADDLIPEFAEDEREFVRRAAFAMMAVGAVHLKKRPDDDIIAWLPLVERHASDPRNFVKKADNWALRQIGKRSLACHIPALALAETLSRSDDKTERWIGKDAAKELSSDKVKAKLASKSRPAAQP